MIIDTSALIAILRGEPEGEAFTDLALAADAVRISAGTLLEAQIVALAYRSSAELEELLELVNAEVVPFDAEQAGLALAAFRSFGKGRHPAGLNFGDCFAYAAAKASGEPLLCKGKDFVKTDLALVEV